MIPISTLKASPFTIAWNTGVYATVQAFNAYGNSAVSIVGNGAIITTVPDAPINIATNATLNTAT